MLGIMFELLLAAGIIQGDPVIAFRCPPEPGLVLCNQIIDWNSEAEKWYVIRHEHVLCWTEDPKTEAEPCNSANYYEDKLLIKALNDKNHPLKKVQINEE